MKTHGLFALSLAALALVGARALPESAQQKDLREGPSVVIPPPSASLLSVLSIQHHLGVADLVWLEVVQGLGQAKASDVPWGTVLRGTRIVIRLDQRYEEAAYAAASALLAFGKEPSMAKVLLLEAHERMPSSWRMPFLLGYHAMFVQADFKEAAGWYVKAAQLPKAPRYLPALAGRVRFLAGDATGAVEFLKSLLPTLPPLTREDAQWRLNALESEQVYRAYDEACVRWRAEHKAIPSIEDVRPQVALPPVDTFGAALKFDEECRTYSDQVKVTQRSRSLEEFIQRIGKAQ